MTSLAFILGVLPLAISTGAGAGARHSIGHRRDGRHARRDVPRDLLRAAVLPAHHRAPPARAAQHATSSSTRSSTRARSPITAPPMTPGHPPHPRRWETIMRKRILAIALAAVLAGCASTQPLPPTLDLPAGHRRRAQARALVDGVRRPDARPARRRGARQQPRPRGGDRAHRDGRAAVLLAQSDLYPDRRSTRRRVAVAHDPGRLQSAAAGIFAAVDRPSASACRRPTSSTSGASTAPRPRPRSGPARDRIRARDGAHDGRGRRRALLLHAARGRCRAAFAGGHAEDARRDRRAAAGPLRGRRHRRVRPAHGGGRARGRRGRHRSCARAVDRIRIGARDAARPLAARSVRAVDRARRRDRAG